MQIGNPLEPWLAAPADRRAEPPATWRVIPLQVSEPGRLLEDALVLLERAQQDPRPTLRWYRASTTAVVLGRGQRIRPSPASVASGDIPVVSRHSGGGAVLMDPGLLSLDVVIPPDHPLATGAMGAVFDRVGGAWRDALDDLGMPGLTVYKGPATARHRGSPLEQLFASICYATLGRGEVMWRSRKLVGLAQRRRRHGVLVQCGLLRRWDPEPLLTVLTVGGPGAEVSLSSADHSALRHAAVGLDAAATQMGLEAPADEAVMAAVQRRLGWIAGPGGRDTA